jgi:hypothetical protein
MREPHGGNPDGDQNNQPNHQNYQKWVDPIGNAIEAAQQRLRWLVISWRKSLHLGFGPSRSRLAALYERAHSGGSTTRLSRAKAPKAIIRCRCRLSLI